MPLQRPEHRFRPSPAWRCLPDGATVMVVAPAGPVDPARLAQVPALILAQGWVPCIAPGCAMQRGDLAGDDTRRLADLQAALDDPDVAAVWCLRGGYGSARLRPALNLAGMLGDVAGVLLGSFTEAEDCGAALRDHLLALGVPLLAGWPTGHGTPNRPLPLGFMATLDADAGTLRFDEDVLVR